jgi:PAS domain S-box-containing protein
MLCVLGYDGYYKRVNPAFERTLGFTSHELLSRPFVDFVHPEDRAASEADLAKLGSGTQTGVYEERHLHKDGSYRWLHWTAVADGGDDSCYALARDVTDRKQAEAELAASRTRIVEAADDARRRIERDLHDGAQQTLVSLALKLRLIRNRITEPQVGAMLDDFSDELGGRRSRSCASSRAASILRSSRRAASRKRCMGSQTAPRLWSTSTWTSSGFRRPSRQPSTSSPPKASRMSRSTRTRRMWPSASIGVSRTVRRSSRSPTMGSAGPIRPPVPACRDSPTALRRSADAWR